MFYCWKSLLIIVFKVYCYKNGVEYYILYLKLYFNIIDKEQLFKY